MTNLSLSAAASGETKTADQNHKRAPDGADSRRRRQGQQARQPPEGASDVGLAVTDVPDGWPAILQPIAAGDEGRKLMRDLVLRALV